MSKPSVQITQPATLLLMAISLLLSVPAIGLFLSHDELAARHFRELAEAPSYETYRTEPGQAFHELDAWINDRIGFGLLAGNLYRRFSYHILQSDPGPNLVRNDQFVFLTSHDAAVGWNAPERFSSIRNSCPNIASWDDIFESQTENWQSIRAALQQSGYQTGMLIIPSKKTLYSHLLPATVPASLRADCAQMSATQAPAIRLAAQDTTVVYPFEALSEFADTPHFYPPENFHADGGSAFHAARAYAQAFYPELVFDIPMGYRTGQADLSRVFGFSRTIQLQAPDYGARRPVASTTLRSRISTYAPRAMDYSAYESTRVGRNNALVISNSFGGYVAGHLAPYYGHLYHINLNNFTDAEIASVFNELLASLSIDDVVFAMHDEGFHTGFLDRVSSSIDGFDIPVREPATPDLPSGIIENYAQLATELRSEQGLDFSIAFAELLGSGWFNPEPAHIWSRSGLTAELYGPASDLQSNSSYEVFVRAFADGAYLDDRFSVRVCGESRTDLADALRNAQRLWVPLPTAAECADQPALEFLVHDQPSPLEAGIGGDQRNLGIAVLRIRERP